MTTTTAAWLDLEGAANARDVGGLPLEGGGRTAHGVLLRSDNLQGLTRADVDALVETHGVRVVVDLRTGIEVELEGPGPLVADGRAEIRHRSLYPEAGQMTDAGVDRVFPWKERKGDPDEIPAVRSYLGYLRDRPDSIVAALRDVSGARGATIVHCAAGKDRTGVVVALALAVAGATRAAIVADYVATGDRIEPLMARLQASPTYAADLAGSPPERHRPHAENMERVLARIDESHGGPLAWLEAHGFQPAAAEALRRRLTQSS